MSINNHTIINLTFYKSTRKNSKSKTIQIFHFDETTKYQDAEKIVSAISKTIPILKEYRKIIIQPSVAIKKTVERKTLNDDNYKEEKLFNCYLERKELYSFEQLINEIYNVYSLAVSETMLSSYDLFENKSIKHFIKEYYHG